MEDVVREARVERLVAEVIEQNQLYERGEMDRAFWLGQQQRLREIKDVSPKLTQAQIGAMVGKGVRWVQETLRWDSHRDASPFGGTVAGDRREISQARKMLREQPEAVADEIADAAKRLPRDKRTEIGQAIFEQDRADYEADPESQRATKHAKDRDHELDARQALSKALWALRARLDFYGDVPLNEHEIERVAIIRLLLERLEAGLAMDDELAAMLEGVE